MVIFVGLLTLVQTSVPRCASVADEVAFYNRYYKTQFGNKADHKHALRVSKLFAEHAEDSVVLLTGGLNRGELLNNFLTCRRNISVFGFEIQREYVKLLHEHYKTEKNIRIFHLGMSNTTGVFNVSSSGEFAGLYDFGKPKSIIKGLPKGEQESVHAVPLHQFVITHNINVATYVSIDAEGHDSTIIQGMRLDNVRNRQIFPVIQFELGVENDPRRPEGSISLNQTASLLFDYGYDLFIIGEDVMVQVTGGFFDNILKSDGHIVGNAMAINPEFAHLMFRKLINSVHCDPTRNTFDPAIVCPSKNKIRS